MCSNPCKTHRTVSRCSSRKSVCFFATYIFLCVFELQSIYRYMWPVRNNTRCYSWHRNINIFVQFENLNLLVNFYYSWQSEEKRCEKTWSTVKGSSTIGYIWCVCQTTESYLKEFSTSKTATHRQWQVGISLINISRIFIVSKREE